MGKGSAWRKRTDFKKYQDAEIWDVFKKRREMNKKTNSMFDESDFPTEEQLEDEIADGGNTLHAENTRY